MAKGLIVIYGPPGAGKSFEARKTFRDALVVDNAENNGHYFNMWRETPEGLAVPPPKRVLTYETYYSKDSASTNRDENGEPLPEIYQAQDGTVLAYPTKPRLEMMSHAITTKALTERATRQPMTYRNLIIDEAGTFWARVFEEIVPTCVSNSGKIDTRQAYGVMAKWSQEYVAQIRQVIAAGMNVVLIAHDGDPDIATGKKGGPKFPSKSIMSQLCSIADAVIMRDIEDQAAPVDLSAAADPMAAMATAKSEGPKRIWKVHASQNWLSKLRGVPDSMFEQVKTMELEDILRLAGFEP